MIFILGAKGFLGSALTRYCESRGWENAAIDKDNYDAWRGCSCDVLVNANGNSKKLLAKQVPLEDFDLNVRNVRASLEDFHAGAYVHFSSADVYPDSSSPETTVEDVPLDPARQTPYGFHKYLSEQCVRHRTDRWLVLRLSGFVGPGLKKNAVHDVLAGGPLWVDLASQFQYLHVDDLSRIVFDLTLDQGVRNEILNIGARGVVSLSEVASWAGRKITCYPGSPLVRCELNLAKLSRYTTLPETAQTVHRFLAETQRVPESCTA